MELKFDILEKEKSDQDLYILWITIPRKQFFVVANQWTFIENSNRRADIYCF